MNYIKILFSICFCLLYTGHAFAFDSGLLDGKEGFYGSLSIVPNGQTTLNLTDNDINTSATIPSYPSPIIWFKFDEPTTIDSYKFMGSGAVRIYYRQFGEENRVVMTSNSTRDGDRTFLKNPIYNVEYVGIGSTSGNGVVGYEFNLYKPIDNTPPSEINGIQKSSTDTSISIKFNIPNDDDYKEARIYRGGDLIYVLPKPINEFKEEGLQPETEYEYRISTVDYDGNESEGVLIKVTTQDASYGYVDDVSNVQVYAMDDRIRMTWEIPPQTSFVEVRIFKNGILHAVATTPATQFIDYDLTPNTEYTYLIRSRSETGYMSPGVNVKVKTTGAPLPPKNFYGIGEDGQVRLFWDGSDSRKDYNFRGFHVYKDGIRLTSNPINLDRYTVTGLENDKEYTFYVTAIDDLGLESVKSYEIKVIPVEFTAPDVHNLRVATARMHYIRFVWDPDPNAEKYIGQVTIKKAQSEMMGFSFLAESLAESTNEIVIDFETTENEYIVKDLEPGDTATISVKAYHSEFPDTEYRTITGQTTYHDPPEFNADHDASPLDLFRTAMSLANNFWGFFFLGMALIVAPWIYFVARKSAKTKAEDEKNINDRRMNRQLNRDIRAQLRKGEK